MSETASGHDRPRGGKGREAFRTISEVADELDLPQHVLRFWESKFAQIKPLKRGGNRRYYRPDDVTLLKAIKKLLHSDGYTIRGVQKLFKAQGMKTTVYDALDLDAGGPEEQAPRVGEEAAPEAEAEADEPSDQKSGQRETLREVLISLKTLRNRLG